MDSKTGISKLKGKLNRPQSILSVTILWTLFSIIPYAEANSSGHSFDFGDFIALVLIIALSFGGVCACLGKYARARAGQLTS